MKKIGLFLLVILSASLTAQTQFYPIGFIKNNSIPIYNQNDTLLDLHWIGGVNSIHFSEIDLNHDGHQDLFGFEKHGNRILPFLWNTVTLEYVYAPEYIHSFPPLHDWVILKDFNNDGLEDIFTYGLGSIRVFQQTSSSPLQFTIVTEQLQSYYYNGYVNIFTSPDDYLAVEDFDFDGDLDIVNFWILGKYVHLQKNLSKELYGNSDSLKYTLSDECWGGFSEGADNNTITLFTNCQNKEWDSTNESTRHIGSSLQAIKNDQDTLFHLLVGDVDYPDLIFLTNGGTQDSALMVSQTTQFPNQTDPIHLFSMPSVSLVDVDHDGQNEILASPSDPSLNKSQDLNSVWLYDFQNNTQNYQLETTSFIQNQTIDVGSGAYPVLYDWNNDGLKDLFVANFGSYDSSKYVNGLLQSYYSSGISYFQNIGTQTQPAFKWITHDFGNLKKDQYQSLYPAFADLDQNGTIDMLCGNMYGTLTFFPNQNPIGQLLQFGTPVPNYQNISVSSFSTPQLFDLDGDGDLDLVIGNRRGQIAYYQNIAGQGIPNFQLVTTTLGNVDVRDITLSYFGYSVPQFFKFNNQTYLICGSEQGEIFLYKNIDNNLLGTFTQDYSLVESFTNTPYLIDEGIRCGAAIADLNGDQRPELIVGNWAGGLTFFSGSAPIPVEITKHNDQVKVYPNPATDQITIELGAYNEATIQLFSITGQLITSIECNNPINSINCTSFSNGFYFLKIKTHSGVITKKVGITN
ncbi:MAG TPA: FG-GAP-like repeat-containing protein [Bacteroidales bacterium]|nr:FG-GAP-like repeat-containing protein [Bacteroidales bacterium]